MDVSWADILLSIVVFSSIIMGVAVWTGSMASVYDINDSANATYLSQIGNISKRATGIKANLDIEGDPSPLEFLGAPKKLIEGAWSGVKMIFQAPDLIESMLTSLGEEDSPIIIPTWASDFVRAAIMIIVVLLILQVILNRQRGIV